MKCQNYKENEGKNKVFFILQTNSENEEKKTPFKTRNTERLFGLTYITVIETAMIEFIAICIIEFDLEVVNGYQSCKNFKILVFLFPRCLRNT